MFRRRHMLLIAFGLLLSGCVTWHEIPIPQPPAPPSVQTSVTRVRLHNGQAPEFLTLVVATDSLFGIRKNEGRTQMSISFDQVQRIEVRKKDAVRTLGLLGLITLGILYSGAAGPRL